MPVLYTEWQNLGQINVPNILPDKNILDTGQCSYHDFSSLQDDESIMYFCQEFLGESIETGIQSVKCIENLIQLSNSVDPREYRRQDNPYRDLELWKSRLKIQRNNIDSSVRLLSPINEILVAMNNYLKSKYNKTLSQYLVDARINVHYVFGEVANILGFNIPQNRVRKQYKCSEISEESGY